MKRFWDKPCTSILLGLEKGHILHANTAGGGKGYTLYTSTRFPGRMDTPCTITSTGLAVERIHLARPYCWRCKEIHPANPYCMGGAWKEIHPGCPHCWLCKVIHPAAPARPHCLWCKDTSCTSNCLWCKEIHCTSILLVVQRDTYILHIHTAGG